MTRIKIKRPEPVPTPEPLFRTVFNSKPQKIRWGNDSGHILRVRIDVDHVDYRSFDLDFGLADDGTIRWISQARKE